MKNKLINLAKDNNLDLEIYEVQTKNTALTILNNQEKSFQVTNVKTYLLKAIQNKKCVKINVASLKKPREIINYLLKIFNIQDNTNENYLSENNLLVKEEPKEILDYQKIKKDLLSLNKLKEEFPFLKNIEIGYTYEEESAILENSQHKMQENNFFHCYEASCNMKNNGVSKIIYVTYYSKYYDFLTFKEMIIAKLENLVLKLKSSSLKTGKYNLILIGEVATDLLARFSPMFNAKNIMMKESVLSNSYQKKIFKENITIIEDPQSTDFVIKKHFDSEGIKTSYKVLVNKGIFQNKVNDIEYALKLKSKPTGNADMFCNLYLKPSSNDFKTLVKKLNNGLIIDSLYGLHSGVDIKTGHISLQAEGLKVQNGQITQGLENIILATDLFELFNNVYLIGNDLAKNNLNVKSPSLLITNIMIAGKEVNNE